MVDKSVDRTDWLDRPQALSTPDLESVLSGVPTRVADPDRVAVRTLPAVLAVHSADGNDSTAVWTALATARRSESLENVTDSPLVVHYDTCCQWTLIGFPVLESAIVASPSHETVTTTVSYGYVSSITADRQYRIADRR